MLDPAACHADYGSSDHRQIEGRGAVADATAVLSGSNIPPEMQTGLDGLSRLFLNVEAAGEPGRLLHEGKSGGLGCGVKGDQATRLGAAPIALVLT